MNKSLYKLSNRVHGWIGKTTVIVMIIAGSLAIVSPASAGCVRHFKNVSSDATWKVVIYDTYQNIDRTIIIKPKQTARMSWSVNVTHLHTKYYDAIVLFRNGENMTKGWTCWAGEERFGGYCIDVQKDADCVYLRHKGSTGKNTLNHPANADLKLH